MKLDLETLIVGLRTEMSVQEIARRAGLSRAHVDRLQRGDVRRPSYETVIKLQRLVDRTAKSAAMPKAGIVTRKV
jgi:transcriptional regulator with XRE-family HTH domain